MKTYFVYIMSSDSGTLYVGVTNDLARRVYQHKHKLFAGFTSRYSVNKLVYAESTESIEAAIVREKQIKGWVRRKKEDLIRHENPGWRDISLDWE